MHSTSMANSNTNSNTVRSDNTLFQSNTARQIMSERGNAAVAAVVKPEQTKTGYAGAGGATSNNSNNNQSTNQYKRFTPRKKKRHNTAPTSENFMDYMAERDSYKYVSSHWKFIRLKNVLNLIVLRRIIIEPAMTWTWKSLSDRIHLRTPFLDHRMWFDRPSVKTMSIYSTK